MSASDKHRLARRDKVLLAARRCFIRRGFHATGMAEIAKACRMSVGNIYHYFSSKEAIVRAITEATRSRIAPTLRRFEENADPSEAIVQIILFGAREACRGSDARLWTEISAEAPRNRLIRETYLALDREIRAVLEALLRKAVEAGRLPPGLDVEMTSIWLVGLWDGVLARVSLEPETDLERALDVLALTLRRCLGIRNVRLGRL